MLEPIKEVPFAELGLGGYTPVGILQHCLEFFHMSLGLPWWGAIAVGKCVCLSVCVIHKYVKEVPCLEFFMLPGVICGGAPKLLGPIMTWHFIAKKNK